MKYVMGSMIKIGYFKSNTELIYQDVIEGNLFEQVDKVMELYLQNILVLLSLMRDSKSREFSNFRVSF